MANASVDDVVDPSEIDGYEIALDKACPTVLYYTEDDDDNYCLEKDGTLEAVTIKVLFSKDSSDIIRAVRIELLSDHDLFFCYTGYAALLVKLINDCIDVPQVFTASLVMRKTGAAKLYFKENAGYKIQDCLSVVLERPEPEYIRSQITYRYRRMLQELVFLKTKWAIHSDTAGHHHPPPRGGGGLALPPHIANAQHAKYLASLTTRTPFRHAPSRTIADSGRTSRAYPPQLIDTTESPYSNMHAHSRRLVQSTPLTSRQFRKQLEQTPVGHGRYRLRRV